MRPNELAQPTGPAAAPGGGGPRSGPEMGQPVRELGPGDAVTIQPDEKHWHGAAPETKMAHFAVNLTLTTEWLEPVSDDQYRAS